MSLPAYYGFYRDVLDALSDGDVHSVSEIRAFIQNRHKYTQRDLDEGMSVFANRTSWAWTYLFHAGLLSRPARAKYQLSEEGKRVQRDPSIQLTDAYLMQYPSFASFKKPTKKTLPATPENFPAELPPTSDSETPQETIDAAYQTINASLSDELMQEVLNQTPTFFEHLVVQLLLKMGYGGPFEDAGITTNPTNDGGIDGIIKEDKLGFNQIYIQAKRWDVDKHISKPEIQKFAGALLGKKATKGLFITTAKFSKGAQDFADDQRIVLIDGEMLTKLMIEYNLGVSTYKTYALKSIDTDFFHPEDSI